MKFIYILISLIILNCSFDNKSGIWNNENNSLSSQKNVFSQFKTLNPSKEQFSKKISINKEFNFKINNPINNKEWKDIFYSQSNNFDNFKYNNINELSFKSQKISKYTINDYLLYEKDNIIFSDEQGNIIVFSIDESKIINKYNFYKKQYKNIKKELNLIIENNVIYVSDNFGYLYAFDYIKNKILWAKNYKTPFRSNLKIKNNKIITANQNNDLYFFDKLTGDALRLIPTEENLVKNEFINNLSLNDKYTLFLNTYGSLYAINNEEMKIAWFINLNKSLDLNPSNLFKGNQIVHQKEKIIVNANENTYVLDINSGSILFKLNLSSKIKPIIMNEYLFLISKNNLLISFNLKNGKIIYSHNINDEISKFLKIKKKTVDCKNLIMVNGKLFVFLTSSYVLKFNIKGNLESVIKLPRKINSFPIFINGSFLYLDKKNKISIIN